MAFLDPVFNPVLLPLISWNPFWGIVILSLVVTIIVTVVYKYATNQEQMKTLKDQQKEYQKRIKELRDNPQEMMKVQGEAMKASMGYMKFSLKPMLITMIPVLLIFGWMAGHLTYEPIYPDEVYNITAHFNTGITGEAKLQVDNLTTLLSPINQNITDSKAVWVLKSAAGEHLVKVGYGNFTQNKTIIISTKLESAEAVKVYKDSAISSIDTSAPQLRPLGRDFNIFGWHPGWITIYIVFSLIFSMGLRKVLKIY